MFRSLWHFLETHGVAVQGIAAMVQAAAAAVTVFVTGWLVSITRRYAQTTQDVLKVGRDQLELYREQFEREWKPNLHVRVIKEDGGAELEVTNLGRMTVVVTRLYVNFAGRTDGKFDHSIPRPFPLAAGARDTVAIRFRLEGMMKKLKIGHKLDIVEGTVAPERIPVQIRFEYSALGATHLTDWFSFTAESVGGSIFDLKTTD
jgi:hypothetical protein